TEGAITALVAILAGESLSAGVGATLVVIVAGVVMSSRPADDAPERGSPGDRDARVAVLCAIGGALGFRGSLHRGRRPGGGVPAAWLLLPARMAGVLAVALPLVLAGRLRLSRAALPFVIVSGLCEVLGFVSFTVGAQHGIAIAAVLASQFAALAAVAAYL